METSVNIQEAKILIVDDTEANVRMLEQMLEQLQYKNIKSITDSRQAVDTFLEWCPDLILLDLMMPHMDGFEVMEKIKALDSKGQTPILMLTAKADQGTRLRALDSGARDFIGKPFDFLEVSLRIRNLLEVRVLNNILSEHNKFLETTLRERSVDLIVAKELLEKKGAGETAEREKAHTCP